jgi:hypothetical protein
MSDSALRRAMIAIAALTVATGAAQVLAPRRVLSPLAAQDDATTGHLFGTVGMFMVVVGGGLLNTLVRPAHNPGVVFFAGLQKIGASIAVALGVRRRIFSPPALLVAGFDLLSGVLAFAYWRRLRR